MSDKSPTAKRARLASPGPADAPSSAAPPRSTTAKRAKKVASPAQASTESSSVITAADFDVPEPRSRPRRATHNRVIDYKPKPLSDTTDYARLIYEQSTSSTSKPKKEAKPKASKEKAKAKAEAKASVKPSSAAQADDKPAAPAGADSAVAGSGCA